MAKERTWYAGGYYRPRWVIRLVCESCGEKFDATRKDAKYCSPRCRKRVSRYMNSSLAELDKRERKSLQERG